MMNLPYTICFCYRGNLVLMLHRNRPPNQGLWNGLGGKIQPGETPFACIQREMIEEASIDLAQSSSCRFAGIVTWESGVDPTSPSRGMYVFLAELPAACSVWDGERVTSEGTLHWLPLAQICDPAADGVADAIPHFLPRMLAGSTPEVYDYYCMYQDGSLARVIERSLPAAVMIEEMARNPDG